MIDPQKMVRFQLERRILATLTEHPPSDARDEQINDLAKELQELPIAPEQVPMTEQERIDAAAERVIFNEKVAARVVELRGDTAVAAPAEDVANP